LSKKIVLERKSVLVVHGNEKIVLSALVTMVLRRELFYPRKIENCSIRAFKSSLITLFASKEKIKALYPRKQIKISCLCFMRSFTLSA